MKVAVVLGTRPEIIKMAPVMRELNKQKIDYFIIHTNQHYSKEMDKFIFRDLELDPAKYNLNVGSGIHGLQTGKMLGSIEEVYLKERPDIVLVHGDTNTTLAGALAAKKLNIKVGHVEAGIRSNDSTMPEEVNRVLVDHMTDLYFVPTILANNNLIKEGVDSSKIYVVGNTVVDAVLQNAAIAEKKSNILPNLQIKDYILITAHRPTNVDSKESLQKIINILSQLKTVCSTVIFPVHPRTKKNIEDFGLKYPKNTKIIEPIGYLDFLILEKNAKLIITDSGGLQEEACIFKVPCVTLRENTERPESVQVGANILSGIEPKNVINNVKKMIQKSRDWKNPFGDGTTSKQIVDILIGGEK